MIKLLNWPTKSRTITSRFGPRDGKFHDGVDIAPVQPSKDGDELFAVADGIVVNCKTNNGGDKVGLGHYLVIQHDGFFTNYAHMQKLGLPVGTKVKAGQVVGYMGHTGSCKSSIPGGTGTHLHFRIGEGTYNILTSHKMDGNGKTFGSVNAEPFLLEIGKEPVSENKMLAIDMVTKGLAKDAEYWEAVFDGRRVADPEYVKTVMQNAVDKLSK